MDWNLISWECEVDSALKIYKQINVFVSIMSVVHLKNNAKSNINILPKDIEA